MNWIGSIFIYIVVWWVVLFAVLPWGVKRNENPEVGHDPGAPAVTHLKQKLIATSLITLVLWASASSCSSITACRSPCWSARSERILQGRARP
jgi:predicted secreted protein